MSNDVIIAAEAAYNKALEGQRIARLNVEELNASLSDWRKKFKEAKAVLDKAKPALAILKAQVKKADADVTLARAELAKVAPEKVASGGNAEHGKVREAVIAMLRAAGSMSADAIFAKLQEQGIEMAGTNPRSNLNAYISRWSKVPELGIVNVDRGVWGINQLVAPAVPSFLAPEQKPEVPSFLAPEAPVVDEPVTEQQTTRDPEVLEIPADAATVLPEQFPGYEALVEAGYTTLESLTGKTHDQLRRIKGVGAGTAREILAALES